MGRQRGDLAGSDMLQRSARMLALIWCCWGPLTGFTDAPLRGEPPSHLPGLEARAGAPRLVIGRRGDRLSVRAREAPWDEVLTSSSARRAFNPGKRATGRGADRRVRGPPTGAGTAATLPRDEYRVSLCARLVRRGLSRPADPGVAVAEGRLRGGGASDPAPLGRLTPVESQDEMTSAGKTTTAIPREEGAPPEGEPVTEAAEADQEERLAALDALAQQGDTEALRKALFDPDRLCRSER